jgi:hypothetical protein
MNGAEKDSERNGKALAVLLREICIFLFSSFRPLRASANPDQKTLLQKVDRRDLNPHHSGDISRKTSFFLFSAEKHTEEQSFYGTIS